MLLLQLTSGYKVNRPSCCNLALGTTVAIHCNQYFGPTSTGACIVMYIYRSVHIHEIVMYIYWSVHIHEITHPPPPPPPHTHMHTHTHTHTHS